MIAHLDDAAGIGENDGDEERLRRLATLLAEAGSSDAAGCRIVRRAPVDSGRGRPCAACDQRAVTQGAAARPLPGVPGGACRSHPLLVVLEDAHWIDPTSGEIFETLIGTCRMLPVLFVLTHRPEYSPPWLGHAHVTALRLNRLGRSDIASLVRQVAGDRELPGALVEQILERTDGVPLFVEEVTKSVLESGAAQSDLAVPRHCRPRWWRASIASARDARWRRLARRWAASSAMGSCRRSCRCPTRSSRRGSGNSSRPASCTSAAPAVFRLHVQARARAGRGVRHDAQVAARAAASAHRDVFRRRFPDMVEHHPDILALHCRQAGLWPARLRTRSGRAPGARPVGRDGSAGARRTRAGRVAGRRGRRAARARRSPAGAFGEALIMTQGFGSPRVKRRCRGAGPHRRARVSAWRRRALGGLFNYHLSGPSRRFASRLPSRCSSGRPSVRRVRGAVLRGGGAPAPRRFRGVDPPSRIARDCYDEDACRPLAFVAAGTHLHSFTLIWLGLGYLYTGSAARGAETIAAAVTDARSRSHPFTLVSALLAQARFRAMSAISRPRSTRRRRGAHRRRAAQPVSPVARERPARDQPRRQPASRSGHRAPGAGAGCAPQDGRQFPELVQPVASCRCARARR